MSRTKKKLIMYACILAGILLITFIVSYVTGVDTNNTWLALLSINAFFLTIIIMLFDIIKPIKHARPLARYVVYFVSILLLLPLIISSIDFIWDTLR